MENFNAINCDASAFTVTDNTTLGELLTLLNLGDKPHETPTPKMLRETAGAPIATEERCTVYANGYAVYDNGSGRTVVWLPSCTSFTYHFDALKDSEKGGEMKETTELPEGLLESLPWTVAVSLIGDHRVEANMMNRMGSRTGTKDYDSDDTEDHEGRICNVEEWGALVAEFEKEPILINVQNPLPVISPRLRRKMRSAYQCRVVIRSVGECVARYSAGKRRMLLRKKAFTTTDILGSEKSIE